MGNDEHDALVEIGGADTLDDIEQLAALVAASTVTEVTVRWPGGRVRIRKPSRGSAPADAAVQHSTALVPAPQAALTELGALPEPPRPEFHWITAPIVGVFRHAEPPVAQGSRVQAGQPVGAIESMKLFTDVPADFSGVVREVAIEGGMAVEYGQPLLAIAVEEP